MKKGLFKWLILSMAVYAAGYAVPGIFVEDIWTAVLAGAILLFINTLVKPVVKILTIPLLVVTFGLFSLILNGLFFLFVSKLIVGLVVESFLAALIGSIIVSVLTWLVEKITD